MRINLAYHDLVLESVIHHHLHSLDLHSLDLHSPPHTPVSNNKTTSSSHTVNKTIIKLTINEPIMKPITRIIQESVKG